MSFSNERGQFSSQIINPFICSTDDFIEERTYLNHHVFPLVQNHGKKRTVSFLPFEWDHSIDEDRLKKGHALYLSLRCIENASPFCIVLFGTEYGPCRPNLNCSLSSLDPQHATHWVDKNLLIAAQSGYSWLMDDSYSSTSLFELKIIQAAFLEDNSKFCRFYVREQLPPSPEQSLTESDRHSRLKLQQLKSNLAKNGLYVSYYSNVQELGELVLHDWTSIINQLYPQPCEATIGDGKLVDDVKHQGFRDRTSQNLIRHSAVDNLYKQLCAFSTQENKYKYDPFVRAKHFEKSTGIRLLRKGRSQISSAKHSDEHKSVCVVTGPRGSGKTALVSNWLQNEAGQVVPSDTAIIYHYATCDRMARNIAVFMKRCIRKLRQAFMVNYDDELSMESEFSQFSQIKETFLAALALGPCLIIFDGLDEITATMGHSMIEMKSMEWLADPLPPTCKLIFTVTDSDLCVKSLRKRKDAVFYSYGEISSTQDKLEILRSYLSQSRKHVQLLDSQLAQVAQYKLSSSPLYLSIIANELLDINVNSNVEAHLDVYANLDSISTSTRDMWTNLIKRWVRDYSWPRYADDTSASKSRSCHLQDTVICGWVPDCLRLIACSRDGLSVDEILGILLHGLGYMGNSTVTQYDWFLFYNTARCVFHEKPNGLITINHEHLTEIVEFLLLGNISPPSLHETSQDSNSAQRLGGMAKRQYHLAIISHLLSGSAEQQLDRVEEVLWQLEIVRDYERLGSILFTPQVIRKLYGEIYCTYTPLRIELIRFYKLLKDKHVNILPKIFAQLSQFGLADKDLQVAGTDEMTAVNLKNLKEEQNKSQNLMSEASAFTKVRRDSSVYQADSDASSQVSRNKTADSLASFSETFTQPSEWPKSNQTTEGGGLEEGESLHENEHDQSNLLIRSAVSDAAAMNMALICAKLLLILDDSREGEKILNSITLWVSQKYPLKYEELYVMCHIYQELSHADIGRQDFNQALEQLHKAQECLLDISSTKEGLAVLSDKLKSYIKACLKIEMSGTCLMAGDLDMAKPYLDEAKVGMEEIQCIPGTKYILYNQALQKAAHQNYQLATDYLLQCLGYFELSYGTMHPIVAEISHSLGVLLSDNNNKATSDHKMGEEYLWKALNIRRERDDESLVTADSLFQLAFLMQKDGSKSRKKAAMELLQNCEDIRSNKLGKEHESTKIVSYLLNDLEISLQLGQFEFGTAKPIDVRSNEFPFSELSMHEKALLERSQLRNSRQRPKSSYSLRPQTTFSIERPRQESRLQQALVRRPKTAPTALNWSPPRTAQTDLRTQSPQLTNDFRNNFSEYFVPEIDHSSANSTPRTFRSCSREGKLSCRSGNAHVLERYALLNKTSQPQALPGDRPVQSPTSHVSSAHVKKHKCHEIGTHTIHKNLHTTTLGPNSTVGSVAGYTRPTGKTEPVHKSAWYHQPNHYATTHKPHINHRVYAERRKRLMQQRSQGSPTRSRYLNDHTNAIKLIAQYESSYS